MSVFTKLGQLIAAPVDENGNARSISPQDFQVWMTEVERFLVGLGLGDLDPEDLPAYWAYATDAGAGTPNAIQATSPFPITEAVLVIMNIATTNGPGPTTVQFNGAGPLYTIKTNGGNDPVEGGLPEGMLVMGRVSGSTFRLVSDQASAAVLAQVEALVDDAAAEADRSTSEAEASAASAALAASYINDAAAEKEVPITASSAGMSLLSFPPGMSVLRTSGHALAGDGGRATRKLFVPEAELAAIVAAYPESLSMKRQWAINNVLRRLKAGGIWSKLNLLVDFGGLALASSAAGLINWKAPSTALVAIGDPTYTAGLGFTGDGVDASISAGAWNTLVGGQDSAHLGVWLTTNANGRGKLNNDFIAGATGGVYIRPNYSGAVRTVVNNSSAMALGSVVGRLGHTVANRSAAGAVEVYRDGRQVGSGTEASSGVVTAPLTFLSYATNFSTDTIGWAHAGASLTAAEVDLIYDVMMEFRHIIEWDADPGKLVQDVGGNWWELDLNGEVNLYQYGAKGNNLADDTQAWIDACALRHTVIVPQPLVAYKVTDEIPVRAHVTGDWAKVNLTIATLNARGFWPQHKSKLKGLDITRTLNIATTVGGDRHNAVLVGQFHDDQRPFHDIEVDVRIRDEGTKRHNLISILGDVKNCDFSVEITGDNMALGMLTHWGSVLDDSAVQQTIQRPRNCRFPRFVHKNRQTAAGYGLYLSGPVDFAFGSVVLEKCNYGSIIAVGDLSENYDLASNNETIGRLMSGLTFDSVTIIDPVFRGFWLVGRSDSEGGTRWYATDLASNPSLEIGTLNVIRGPSTLQGYAVYGELWKNLQINNLNVANKNGVSSTVLDLTHPAMQMEACLDIGLKGRTRTRAGVRLISGARMKIDLDAQNNRISESTSASYGVKVSGANTGATIVNAVATGATSVVLASVPCHICPGMSFEVGGFRYFFAGSAVSGLGDTNITIAIDPAPAAISAGTSVAILNGVSDVDVLGSYKGFYYGFHADSAYSKSPYDVRVRANIKDSALHGALISEGELIRILGGVYDRNNRNSGESGRDIRIDATGKVYDVHGATFSPSPGSRLTQYHVTAAVGASAVSVKDNKFFGATAAATSIPATGADGTANVSTPNWTGP